MRASPRNTLNSENSTADLSPAVGRFRTNNGNLIRPHDSLRSTGPRHRFHKGKSQVVTVSIKAKFTYKQLRALLLLLMVNLAQHSPGGENLRLYFFFG